MSREVMQQALEALNGSQYRMNQYGYQAMETTIAANNEAIAALRAALAEQDRGAGWCPIHQHYKPCEHNTVAQAQDGAAAMIHPQEKGPPG